MSRIKYNALVVVDFCETPLTSLSASITTLQNKGQDKHRPLTLKSTDRAMGGTYLKEGNMLS